MSRQHEVAKYAIKAVLGLSLVVYLLMKFEFQGVVSRLTNVRVGWLLIALTIPHFNILLSAAKWRWLLRALGLRQRLSDLFRLYLIGTFFSNFLPTMAGGDVVRVAQLGGQTGCLGRVVAATFMERFTGVTALISMLCILALFPQVRRAVPYLDSAVAVAVAGYLVLLFLAMQRGIVERISSRFRAGPAVSILDNVQRLQRCLGEYLGHRSVLVVAYSASVTFYLASILAVYASCAALGIEASLLTLTVIVPVVIFIGMLPISINGLGVNETSYALLFAAFGYSSADGLSLALLIRGRILFTAIVGGLLFAFGTRRRTGPLHDR